MELMPDLFQPGPQVLADLAANPQGPEAVVRRLVLRAAPARADWCFDQPSPFKAARPQSGPEPVAGQHRARSASRSSSQAEGDRHRGSLGGTIDSLPDDPGDCVVGRLPGSFLATCFSGQRFGIGPEPGRLAAEVVTGDTPLVDPADYRYKRRVDERLEPMGFLYMTSLWGVDRPRDRSKGPSGLRAGSAAGRRDQPSEFQSLRQALLRPPFFQRCEVCQIVLGGTRTLSASWQS